MLLEISVYMHDDFDDFSKGSSTRKVQWLIRGETLWGAD